MTSTNTMKQEPAKLREILSMWLKLKKLLFKTGLHFLALLLMQIQEMISRHVRAQRYIQGKYMTSIIRNATQNAANGQLSFPTSQFELPMKSQQNSGYYQKKDIKTCYIWGNFAILLKQEHTTKGDQRNPKRRLQGSLWGKIKHKSDRQTHTYTPTRGHTN